MITVRLFGLVRLETGIKELQVEAANGKELRNALTQTLPEETVRGCRLLANGRPVTRTTKLKDGDQVMLMPPVAGG